jgi:RNA polymerase sigma-70 factor (ECF subfamily)
MSEGPDVRLLVEHASFVRRVARGILADEDAVEEIVQGTFLQALRHPPRASSLRSWLARVARNLAISRWRAERSRQGRERAAARVEHVSGGDETAERLETQRRVVDAVMGLDKPYRVVIVHRYFDDMSHAEIAARLGVPVPTVRTRLRRALAQLRARLQEPFGRDRRAMILALAPVAALPRRMGPRTALVAGGAALVKAKGILAVCIVLLGATLYLSSQRVREPSRAVGSDHPAVTTPASAAEAAAAPPASSPRGTVAPGTAAKLVVTGVVHAAAKEALVEIRPETSRGTPGDLIAQVTAATELPFEIPAVDPENAPLALFVRARCAGHVPAEARTVVLLDAHTRQPHVPPVELTLLRGASLRGQVVDAFGAAASAARVAAFRARGGMPEATAADLAACDPEGRFELLVRDEGEYAVVAVSPGARPASCVAAAQRAGTTEVPQLRLEAGEQVTGRVTVTGGSPARGAKVRAVLDAPGVLRLAIPRSDLEIGWCGGRGEWRFIDALADGDGRYRIGGLRPGPYRVVVVGVEGGHPAVTQGGAALPDVVELVTTGQEAFDNYSLIRPTLTRDVRGTATGIDFEVSTATVEFVLAPGAAPPREARLEVAAVEGIVSVVHDYAVGATLRQELVVAPGGELRVRALAEGYEPRGAEITAPAAGARETHRIELVPAPAKATLVITLEPEGPDPLPPLPTAFSASLYRADRPRDDPVTRHLSLRSAEVVIEGLDEGAFRLELFPGSMEQREQNFYRKAVAEVTLRSGETSRLAAPLRAGGRLRILVCDPEGRTDVAADCTIVAPDGTAVPANFAKFDEGGGTSMFTGGLPGVPGPAEVMEPLSPGVYAIRVRPSDATLQAKTVTAAIEVGRLTVVEIGLDR